MDPVRPEARLARLERRDRPSRACLLGLAGLLALSALAPRDEAGLLRAPVTHDEEPSALYLRDIDGQIRVGAAQFAHCGGGAALHGPQGKGGTALYCKDGGSLRFHDREGVVTEQLPE